MLTREQFEEFFGTVHNLLWSRAGLNPEKALEHLTFFFSYRLMERQVDALGLPAECRWSSLVGLAASPLFETIKTGVAAFRKDARTKPFFKMHELTEASLVHQIVAELARIRDSDIDRTDIIGDIYEHMINRGMSTMADEGQYFTSRAICNLAFKLARAIKGSVTRQSGELCTFGDWFCGTGGFAVAYVRGVQAEQALLAEQGLLAEPGLRAELARSVMCQDMSVNCVTTTKLNMLVWTGSTMPGIRAGNSFTDPIVDGRSAPFEGARLDYCLMNPPYGGDKTKSAKYKFSYKTVNAEINSIGIQENEKVSAGVQLAMATLAEGGVCCIVLPQGFFFGASKKAVALRKLLVEKYKVHLVVDIKSGQFTNTLTKTSMLVFQKGVGRTDTITFIDAEESTLAVASLEQVRERSYILEYKRYVVTGAATHIDPTVQMVALGDIAEIRRGTPASKERDEGTMYPAYGGGDLMSYKVDAFNRDGINYKVSCKGLSRHNCIMKIHGKCFLIESALTVHSSDPTRALDGYIGEWLLMHKEQVYELGRGTAQKNLDVDGLKCMRVPLPSIERQRQIVDSVYGWEELARTEDAAIKMIETSHIEARRRATMELSYGKPVVPLGDIAEIRYGTRVTKEKDKGTMYPAYGGGDVALTVDSYNRDGLNYKVSRFGISRHNCVMKIHGKCFLNDNAMTVHSSDPTRALDGYIGEWLLMHKEQVYELGRGTAQKALDVDGLRCMQIPLPSIQEQQTLVSDFEEIAHKRGKAAEYEAKARSALSGFSGLSGFSALPALPALQASDDLASDQSTSSM
jgi:type I restriction-modification system DNA methylase subunit/restriction endonuclease S subunit